jgi:N-acetyl-anhydromuramyl-L-alanine amidase AmpD
VKDLIPFGPQRKAQMAAYSLRHYGVDTWRMKPKVIVLHFTASSSYPGVHAEFASDAPNLGEEPGVCAQYVIDQDGTVYEQVTPTIQCRHTIGLDDIAIGIENVQITGPDAHWADQQILRRPAQIRADLLLVKWLQAIYHIPTRNITGHAMANTFRLFHDDEGWTNDHSDCRRRTSTNSGTCSLRRP